jgi:RND family efflux transporter MFP subunit
VSASSPSPSDSLAKLRIQRDELDDQQGGSGALILRVFVWFLILALISGVGFYLVAYRGIFANAPKWMQAPEALRSKIEVRRATISVESGRAADATVVATGYLESRRQAKIGARAPGRIESVNVEEGSRVKAKEILAVLEHADLDASLAAAEASLARAKAEIGEHRVLIANNKLALERAKQLQRTNNIAEAEYEQSLYQYESAVARLTSLEAAAALAEARVKEAMQMKENMFVRAPFDGTVISKDGEVGESILPGGMGEASGRGSVVTIADLEHLEVDCNVKEDYISRIREGQYTEVAVDAVPGFRFQGQVRKIIPMGDRARATIKVKVAILNSDGRLFPDMSGTVYFLPDSDMSTKREGNKRVFCSSEAIAEDALGKFVWELDADDRVIRKSIKVGEIRDGRIEVLEGLTGSESIVIGPPSIRAGQLVKVTN